MVKKRRHAPPKSPGNSTKMPEVEDEVYINEADMLQDEIDEELLDRDEIRFSGDNDESDDDDDLKLEGIMDLPDDESDSDEDVIRERGLDEIQDDLREGDKSWGKSKAVYYEDESEEDLSSGEEEEMEEEEEKEAMALQKRLLKDITADDFTTERDVEEADDDGGVIKADYSSLGKDEKLLYLLKNCPELPEFLEEFREKLSETLEPLYPLLQLGRQTSTFSNRGNSYIETKYKLNLLCALNIGFYLLLQSSKTNKDAIKLHPVIGRLLQLRKLSNLTTKTDITLEDEIKNLLDIQKEQQQQACTDSALETERKRSYHYEEEQEEEEDLYEAVKKRSDERKKRKKRKTKSSGIEMLSEDPTLMDEEGDEGKRGITYKIMKNKGLAPHRKKEQRNPRVKHRKKYDKALKKRRSQVPDLRYQEGAYGGEKTGIKATVMKSTILK